MSSPAYDGVWRWYMAKRFFFIEFVAATSAAQCSTFARTAIADTATAAPSAAIKTGVNSGGRPINGTNRATLGGSIITTTSGSTGGDAAENKFA